MKKLKFILLLFISATILSCGDDSTPVVFSLSNVNVAGSYDINSITYEEVETVTSSSGNSSIILTTIRGIADSFDDINFVLNSNGTYTASGKYRIVITETPNVGSPITDNEIIVFDADGSYQLDTVNNTITFNQQNGDFIEGVFNISTFNQNSVIMGQEDIDIDGNTTLTFKGNISLVRK